MEQDENYWMQLLLEQAIREREQRIQYWIRLTLWRHWS